MRRADSGATHPAGCSVECAPSMSALPEEGMPKTKPMCVPSCYVDGYEAARGIDPAVADDYIRYTTLGDPVADAVVAELAQTATPAKVHGIIASSVNNHHDLPAGTPDSLRNLIADAGRMPEWFDPDLALQGTRGFLRNSDMVLGGLVGGAIIEGFSTLISKSFRIRSRITENGVRRLKQNLLQLVEQFMPGGLEPGGDGWRLSLRIRLVHAQARRLVRGSDEWDEETYGLPLSTAHMLLGAATFSARLMQHVARLGGDFTDEEREGYVHVWRYTAKIMGVPESILFTDYASALRTFEVAVACEPPRDDDAIIMANSIVNSAPILLGFAGDSERRDKAQFMYQVSRELIGDKLADDFRYPPGKLLTEVPLIRLRNVAGRIGSRVVPGWRSRQSFAKFSDMLEVSDLGQSQLSYALPDTVYDEDSHNW